MFLTSRFVIAGLSLVVLSGAYMTAADRAQESAQKPSPPVMHGFDGQDQFATYCASCHGTSAKGDGTVGALLKKKPPDLTMFAARNGGVYDADLVFKIIDGRAPVQGHGGADMPVWGDAFSKSKESATPEAVKDRIDAIVKWLGRMQVKPPSQ